MYRIYLVNNDFDMTGLEQGVQVPEIQQNPQNEYLPQNQEGGYIQNPPPLQETLPALPDMTSETSVTDKDISSHNNMMNISLISAGIILLILAVLIIKKLISRAKEKTSNENKSNNSIVDEIFDSKVKVSNKNFATPANLKKCIRLFLENTRIR